VCYTRKILIEFCYKKNIKMLSRECGGQTEADLEVQQTTV